MNFFASSVCGVLKNDDASLDSITRISTESDGRTEAVIKVGQIGWDLSSKSELKMDRLAAARQPLIVVSLVRSVKRLTSLSRRINRHHSPVGVEVATTL